MKTSLNRQSCNAALRWRAMILRRAGVRSTKEKRSETLARQLRAGTFPRFNRRSLSAGNWRRTVVAVALLLLSFVTGAQAAEVIPPAPRDHFNDYAGIVDPGVARRLDDELTQFERDTSNQIVVAIYPHMQSDSSIEDYTVRVAQAWGVGQKDRKNGAVLFIFSHDRKLFIQVGYGLEGALPDARCNQIIENEIKPRFRAGDFTGGVEAGVHAMLAATRGEYRGTGRTNAGAHGKSGITVVAFIFVLMMLLFSFRTAWSRASMYGRSGRRIIWGGPGGWGGGGWGGGGGWSGGGGGGGGGSFSGGGGSFGGGGAGGSW